MQKATANAEQSFELCSGIGGRLLELHLGQCVTCSMLASSKIRDQVGKVRSVRIKVRYRCFVRSCISKVTLEFSIRYASNCRSRQMCTSVLIPLLELPLGFDPTFQLWNERCHHVKAVILQVVAITLGVILSSESG